MSQTIHLQNNVQPHIGHSTRFAKSEYCQKTREDLVNLNTLKQKNMQDPQLENLAY